jgi:hypothetical protein
MTLKLAQVDLTHVLVDLIHAQEGQTPDRDAPIRAPADQTRDKS